MVIQPNLLVHEVGVSWFGYVQNKKLHSNHTVLDLGKVFYDRIELWVSAMPPLFSSFPKHKVLWKDYKTSIPT